MTTIIAVNQTAGAVFLERLGVTVPASGNLTLTDTLKVYEIQDDDQLKDEITADVLLINDGTSTLTKSESLNYVTPMATTGDPNITTTTDTGGGAVNAGKFLVLDGGGFADGRDLGADGAKLDTVQTNAQETNFANIAAALDGEGGAVPGLVFKTDGAGGGTMELNTRNITNVVTVGRAGDDVDFTSVKAACDFVLTQSPSGTNPWLVQVAPAAGPSGVYVEDPFTVVTGMVVSTIDGQRPGTVTITANNPNEDLVTMIGGGLNGLDLNGVTDPTKAVVRCATPGALSIFFNCAIRACSTGFQVENGTQAVFVNHSTVINNINQHVTSAAIRVTGLGTFAAFSGGFISVPAPILPFYATNPVERGIICTDQAHVSLTSMFIGVRDKDGTTKAMVCEDDGKLSMFSVDMEECSTAFHIGTAGSNAQILIQGATIEGCTTNFEILDSTGTIFATCNVDSEKNNIVAGATLSGIFQESDTGITDLSGAVDYQQPTGRKVDFEPAFRSLLTSGISASTDGVVTDAGGLTVDVGAGGGWVRRSGGSEDTTNVTWTAMAGLAMTASSTNYVAYNGSTLAIEASLSPPSSSMIPLAEVITDGADIRFIHDIRTQISQKQYELDEYLFATRKFAIITGCLAAAGTGARKIDVSSGSWYRGMFPLSYAGSGGDATWSSFYGTAGANETPGVTDVDITNYDNAGVLTAMTAGFWRSDTLMLTSDGRLSLFYGDGEFATENDALSLGTIATIPAFLEQTGIRLARVIVEQGVGISQFLDIRPTPNAAMAPGTGATTTAHSALSGLGPPADDHPQYSRTDGTRPFSGDIDIGGNNITNVNLVDGVDVSAHAARHQPGGADEIPTAAPVGILVGATPSDGSAATISKSDHQHGITAGTAVTLTPDAGNSAGSGSSVARDNHVHNVPTAAPTQGIGGGNAQGVAATFARSGHDHAIRETSGPTDLTVAGIEDGQAVRRSGSTLAGNWFGTFEQLEEELAPLTTTIGFPTYQTKATLTTTSLPAGDYLLHWSYLWNLNSTTSDFVSRVLVDGSATNPDSTLDWAFIRQEPKDAAGPSYPPGSPSGTNQSFQQSGYFRATLTAGVHTFTLQWCPGSGGVPATIWDTRLLLYRLS